MSSKSKVTGQKRAPVKYPYQKKKVKKKLLVGKVARKTAAKAKVKAKSKAAVLSSTNTSIQAYSGKFTVRLPKVLHQALSQRAAKEGVSLNLLITSVLSASVGFRRKK